MRYTSSVSMKVYRADMLIEAQTNDVHNRKRYALCIDDVKDECSEGVTSTLERCRLRMAYAIHRQSECILHMFFAIPSPALLLKVI
jgi:hypothetical protein